MKKIIYSKVFIAILFMAVGIGSFAWMVTGSYKHMNYDRYIELSAPPEQIKVEKVKPTKKAIEKEAEREYNRAKNKTRKVSGETKEGDTVFVDYISSVDGRLVDGGSGEDVPVRIGESNIPFAESLEGREIGETVKTEVKIPKDYANTDVAGKTVTFEVKINAVRGDLSYKQFLKANGFPNDKAYKESLSRKLSREMTKAKKKNEQERAWAEVITQTKVKKCPKRMVKKEAKKSLALMSGYAKAHGMSMGEYQKKILRVKKSEAEKIAQVRAEASVKEKLVAYDIAKRRNIKLTKESYSAWEKKYCEKKGVSRENVKSVYGMTWKEYKEKSDLESMALIDRVKGGL